MAALNAATDSVTLTTFTVCYKRATCRRLLGLLRSLEGDAEMKDGRLRTRGSLLPLVASGLLALLMLGAPASSTAAGPEAQLRPAAWGFGPLGVGREGVPVAFKLESILPSGFSEIKEIKTTSKNFTITQSGCEKTLGAKDTCEILVSFTPQTSGAKLASLVVELGGSTVTSELIGEGVTELALLTPVEHNFKAVTVGQTSKPFAFQLTNVGTEVIEIEEATVKGAGAAFFDVSPQGTETDCKETLAPKESCEIEVVFSPSEAGSFSAFLEVKTNVGSPTSELSGEGTPPVGPFAELTPIEHYFGEVPVGKESLPFPFLLTNIGTETLNIEEITITGAGESSYSIPPLQKNGCLKTLAPKGSCEIEVVFSPVNEGSKVALLIVKTDGGEPQALLRGEGE